MTTNNPSLKPDDLFDRGVHRLGRLTIFICILLALCVPFIVLVLFGVFPPTQYLISGIISVSAFMIPLSFFEILSFYPLLGASGLYISYTTGNISNLKVPCAAIAMEAAGVESNTKEGEVISTIAMAGSVIMSEIILVLGVILLVPLSIYLEEPLLKPAFEQILPALFGSLGAYFLLKSPKLAIIPLAFGIVASIFNIPTGAAVPLCVIFSILGARIMYKKGLVKS